MSLLILFAGAGTSVGAVVAGAGSELGRRFSPVSLQLRGPGFNPQGVSLKLRGPGFDLKNVPFE